MYCLFIYCTVIERSASPAISDNHFNTHANETVRQVNLQAYGGKEIFVWDSRDHTLAVYYEQIQPRGVVVVQAGAYPAYATAAVVQPVEPTVNVMHQSAAPPVYYPTHVEQAQVYVPPSDNKDDSAAEG